MTTIRTIRKKANWKEMKLEEDEKEVVRTDGQEMKKHINKRISEKQEAGRNLKNVNKKY